MAYYVAIPHRFSPEYLGTDGPDDDAHDNLYGETVEELASELDRYIARRGHQWIKLSRMRRDILDAAQWDESKARG